MKKSEFNFLTLLTFSLIFFVSVSYGQDKKMAELKDASLEYYDLGGEGVPLIFIHGDSRDISQYDEFILNFEESNRIIGYGRRGYGNSKAKNQEKGLQADANDLLQLMAYLEIDKAVFIGNSYAGFLMTHLAENYPEKCIGQIYLAGNPGATFKNIIAKDTLNAHKMMFWAQAGEDYANETVKFNTSFSPNYPQEGYTIPNVPALGFLNSNNTRGIENMNVILIYAQRADNIPYEEPKVFFKKIASDSLLIKQVEQFDKDVVKPNLIQDSKMWVESFPSLQIVNLPIPFVTGYEFERKPELIIEPIQNFLNSLKK